MSTDASLALSRVLHQPSVLLKQWLATYVSSKMRLPGTVDTIETAGLMEPILSIFAEAVLGTEDSPPVKLQAGLSDLRELEKSVAFLGATLANTGASGFDVGALLYSLRDAFVAVDPAVAAEINPYCEWLVVLALDSFAAAKTESARERIGEELTNGIPVLQVVQELPAILLVANPATSVLDSLFGRMILLCVRVGASACIIDATGLADQESAAVLSSLSRFLGHQRIVNQVRVGIVGLGGASEARWHAIVEETGASASWFPYFDRAVEWGLETAGYRLVKRQ